MLNVDESSLSTEVTLSLIWSHTPVASRTSQKIVTATTPTIIIATEIANASRVTDHGSMRVSRRLARRPWASDYEKVICRLALGSSLTAGITAVVDGEGLVVL